MEQHLRFKLESGTTLTNHEWAMLHHPTATSSGLKINW